MPSDICKQNNGQSIAFEDFSGSIDLLRFPLILLVVYIHSQFQGTGYPDAETERLCESVFWGKMPYCAVSAFFMFSGYLFASRTMRRKTDQDSYSSLYWEMLRRKSRSLLVPYVLWNTMLMLPHLLIWAMNISSPLLPATKYAGMNFFQILVRTYGLDLRDFPIDVPLWYVRNLMLFFLFSPVFLFLMRRLPKQLTFPLLIALFFLPVNSSLFFFLFGMFCGLFDVSLLPFKKTWGMLFLVPLPVFCLLADRFPAMLSHMGTNIIFVILHVLFFLFLVPFAMLMQRLPERMRNLLVLSGGYSFWIYCTHSPVASLVSRAGYRFGIRPPLFLRLLTCAVTLAISLLAFFVVLRVAPRAAEVLCGGRLPKKSQTPGKFEKIPDRA